MCERYRTLSWSPLLLSSLASLLASPAEPHAAAVRSLASASRFAFTVLTGKERKRGVAQGKAVQRRSPSGCRWMDQPADGITDAVGQVGQEQRGPGDRGQGAGQRADHQGREAGRRADAEQRPNGDAAEQARPVPDPPAQRLERRRQEGPPARRRPVGGRRIGRNGLGPILLRLVVVPETGILRDTVTRVLRLTAVGTPVARLAIGRLAIGGLAIGRQVWPGVGQPVLQSGVEASRTASPMCSPTTEAMDSRSRWPRRDSASWSRSSRSIR